MKELTFNELVLGDAYTKFVPVVNGSKNFFRRGLAVVTTPHGKVVAFENVYCGEKSAFTTVVPGFYEKEYNENDGPQRIVVRYVQDEQKPDITAALKKAGYLAEVTFWKSA